MQSIFDGWTKKVDNILEDGRGGYCARGWIRHHYGLPTWQPREHNAQVIEAESRIGNWILDNLPISPAYRDVPGAAIAFANNEHLLDIEGFRMVDLLTQGYMPEDPEPVDPPTIIIQPEIPTVEPVPLTEPEPELDPVAELVLVG